MGYLRFSQHKDNDITFTAIHMIYNFEGLY